MDALGNSIGETVAVANRAGKLVILANTLGDVVMVSDDVCGAVIVANGMASLWSNNIKSLKPSDSYMRKPELPPLFRIMACLFRTKSLSKPVLA